MNQYKVGQLLPKTMENFWGLEKNISMRHHPLKSNKSTEKRQTLQFQRTWIKIENNKKEIESNWSKEVTIKKSLLQNLHM
jgi:hypothetical protein